MKSEIEKLTDALDMQRDEFKRIKALLNFCSEPTSEEVIDICIRAIQNIEQTVPVVVQRDRLQAANGELRQLLVTCEHALRSYQYGNGSTELAEEIANKVQEALRP